jgi:hypothetical protein
MITKISRIEAARNKKLADDSLPHLVIAIDPGASSIKIVGSLAGDDKCVPITIEPHCIEITDPAPDPNFDEHSVWVTLSNVSYALGNLAIARYDCPLEIKPLKMRSIVQKICAAIAVLHRRFNLPSKFALSISTVLPPGEYIYANDLMSLLSVAFRKIGTPNGVIKPLVKFIDVQPEGFGVMSWHRTLGVAKNKDIGVIMLGFRNASVIFSRNGQITKPKSSPFGFHSVLEKISDRSGGSYPERDLIVPVWRYLIDGDESGFKRIALTDFEMEMSKIRPAIEKGMAEYRHSLEAWLKEAMQPTDVIVMCGGNADYIGDALDSVLGQYVTSSYPVLRHIGSSSIPQELIDTGMQNRFLDIYCLWTTSNNLLIEKK